MKVKIYDSYTGKMREFVPLVEGKASIYYCGPTVYNYVHLGNFRPALTFDVFANLLRECGIEPQLVSNYTDIDDKIIRQSQVEGKSEKELSEYYISAYEDCAKKLNIQPLFAHPKASQYIESMASFIKDLLDTDYAYQSGDDIYFRVDKIPSYGQLSKQNIRELDAGKRIDVSDKKENPFDFALWKLTDDSGIKFDTVLGRGRPGWHTECVVMVNDVFKKPLIDIHGGGFDLKFPHHENEIAQSLAHNGTTLAQYWMHVGFLLTNGVKMSKSLGNSILAKDVIAQYSGNAVRLFFLSTHYRAPINYTPENMENALKLSNRYKTALSKAQHRLEIAGVENGELIKEDYDDFISALADDLNVANALTIYDKEIKQINSALMQKEVDLTKLSALLTTLTRFNKILGLNYEIPQLTFEDKEMYFAYQKAREDKDYQRSDELRKRLIEKEIL